MKNISALSARRSRPLVRKILVLVCCASLSGCAGSILSGSGPKLSAITSEAEKGGYDLIDLSADSVTELSFEPDGRPSHAVTSPELAGDTIFAPGDLLKIQLADNSVEGPLFAQLAAGGSVFNVRVDARGGFSLPYVGRVEAAGLSLDGLAQRLKSKISGIAGDPQVFVELVGDASASVLVAGAVKSPGRVSALGGPLTLLDAINRTGGPLLEPHLTQVTVRNGVSVATYSYQDILNGGNTLVRPRSEIVVERARQRFVAMGAVGKPGLHDLPSRRPSLLEVLGLVGGLNDQTADPTGVFIFRLSSSSKDGALRPQVLRLDMRNPAAMFLARQFTVNPDDAIYVTNAAVYEWQKIISPIVQVLFLGRSLSNF